MIGNVITRALNQNQGQPTEIEKYFLFIGVGSTNQNTVLFLNASSDLDAELGAADSEIKRNVTAARLNAGQNWNALAVPVAEFADWDEAVDLVLGQHLSFEAVVICTPVSASNQLTAMQTKAESINTALGRKVFFIATTDEIDGTQGSGESWNAYIANLGALTNALAAHRVSLVAGIFNNAVGIYAGRLCNYATSIADTPMRVSTGALLGVDVTDLPTDTNGIPYSNAHAQALNNHRLSVPQLYADYPGIYWSDGTTLDVSTGDFAVIENLRVVDKAARLVRIKLIEMIGNRSLNSTPIGEAAAINKLMQPLLDMSRGFVFNKVLYPAEIKPPKEGAIAIEWASNNSVVVYLKVSPYNSPKQLEANILLDLAV